ncbi:MAG: phosphotransferase family protein [Actinomycetes bacterium]
MHVSDDLVALSRLEPWLNDHGILSGSESLRVQPLGEGHSNLTFVIERGSQAAVLRRPPRGPLLPTAHDVVREARIMGLVRTHVPVPEVFGICEDDAVIGAPFYVMERAPGAVVRDALPDFLDGVAGVDQRRAVGLDLAHVLGKIHTTAWQPLVDAGVGRPSGYIERQMRRWTGQREGVQVAVAAAGGTARELPDYDAVRDWLVANMPSAVEPALVHGDYKLDNVLVVPPADGELARISAVIDWEMATVGDPRADLGYLLSFWPEMGETVPLTELVTQASGFPSRDEMVHVWETTTGREAGDTRWFVTLAIWKLAILLEASYYRFLAGTADDPFFAKLDQGVPALLRRAREVTGA